MNELTRLIKEDMRPALGVTEPGAIAFAVASARAHVQGEVRKVRVALNSGMYKNAYTCGIPNSSNFGNLYAAALGAAAADAEKGLESLRDITPEDDAKAAAMVESGMVEAVLDHIGSEITIDATVQTEQDICTVHIRDSHTHIVSIEKNGVQIYADEAYLRQMDNGGGDASGDGEIPVVHQYSLHEIMEYVREVPKEEISFIREAFSMNMELLEEGMASERAVITKLLLGENGGKVISDNVLKTAQLLCNGAIEARVLGLSRPAMSCGIAAGTGMACGLAFMKGADEETMGRVIQNMASGLTGMICDGGNHGCTMKGIVAVDAAFRAVYMAMEGVCIDGIHGINGRTPEDTMRHMGMIASPGMTGTEKTIVEIMEQK